MLVDVSKEAVAAQHQSWELATERDEFNSRLSIKRALDIIHFEVEIIESFALSVTK